MQIPGLSYKTAERESFCKRETFICYIHFLLSSQLGRIEYIPSSFLACVLKILSALL